MCCKPRLWKDLNINLQYVDSNKCIPDVCAHLKAGDVMSYVEVEARPSPLF